MTKFIVYGVINLCSLILSTVATGRTFDPFSSDYYNAVCGKANVGATQAFALLTCIFTAVAMIFGFAVGASAVLGVFPPMKLVGAALAAFLVVFSIIAWAIVADHWSGTYLGTVDAPRCFFQNSVAFLAQFVVVTALSIAAIIVLFVLPDPIPAVPAGGADDKKADEAPKAVKTGDEHQKNNAPDAEVKHAKAAAPAAKKEEAPTTAAAAAPAKTKKKLDVNWKEINAKLPYDKTKPEQKKRRFAMFDEIDTNKTGKVNLEQVTKGLTTVLGLGDKIDVPVVIKTAFDRAAAAGQQAGVNAAEAAHEEPSLEKNEFRLFLMYTRMYFEMYHLFDELDHSGDMSIDEKEFEQALPLLKTWGAKIEDPVATFKQIDKKGAGNVHFPEFVDWALSPEQNLDCPEDDE